MDQSPLSAFSDPKNNRAPAGGISNMLLKRRVHKRKPEKVQAIFFTDRLFRPHSMNIVMVEAAEAEAEADLLFPPSV